MISKTSAIVHILPLALLACAGAAAAKDDEKPSSEYLDGLRACQSIVDGDARLACYDAAAGSILTAAAEGEVRVINRGDVEQTRRRLFGFSLPKLGLFGAKDDSDEELDMLESTITGVRRTGDDVYILTIADGDAVWQIQNAPMRFIAPKKGDKVVFKRASLGSYFIRVNGQLGVKGTRVR